MLGALANLDGVALGLDQQIGRLRADFGQIAAGPDRQVLEIESAAVAQSLGTEGFDYRAHPRIPPLVVRYTATLNRLASPGLPARDATILRRQLGQFVLGLLHVAQPSRARGAPSAAAELSACSAGSKSKHAGNQRFGRSQQGQQHDLLGRLTQQAGQRRIVEPLRRRQK